MKKKLTLRKLTIHNLGTVAGGTDDVDVYRRMPETRRGSACGVCETLRFSCPIQCMVA